MMGVYKTLHGMLMNRIMHILLSIHCFYLLLKVFFFFVGPFNLRRISNIIMACFTVYLLNTPNNIFMFIYVTIWLCRGALMDDAMILPCGHSFGGGGMQHVIKMVSLQQTLPLIKLILSIVIPWKDRIFPV